MNKICTDIQQSKKLLELGIDVDTSDMVYLRSYFEEEEEGEYNLLVGSYHEGYMEKDDGSLIPVFDEHIPAWSLSALLSVIPKRIRDCNVLRIDISVNDFSMWYDEIGFGVNDELPDITEESAVDACYEMIIKLHKKNLL